MKYQVLLSLKNNEKYSRLFSAAVVIGILVKQLNFFIYRVCAETKFVFYLIYNSLLCYCAICIYCTVPKFWDT